MTLGQYTVQRRHWLAPGAEYVVLLGGVVIGRCISCPSESDCAYLHRQMVDGTGYAYSSAPLPQLSVTTGEPGNKPKRSARYLDRKRAGG